MINDIVREALRVSNAALSSVRGGNITYRTAAGAETTMFASPTADRTVAVEEDGFVHDAVLMDWIIRTDQFGDGVTPEQHDRIINGSTVWRVQHPAGGREWDYHDPYQDSYRIHTIMDPDESGQAGEQKAYKGPDTENYENPEAKDYMSGSGD